MKRLRLLVLASGRGSHALNLIEATRAGRLEGEVTRIVCDRPDAPVLGDARSRGVPSTLLEPEAGGARLTPEAEAELAELARRDRADLIALCGFMRILSARFLQEIQIPVLNVHPSLLPSFRGLNAQRQAIEAGVRITGATVHFVDAGIDSGPILLQAALEVRPGESPEELAERLLPVEHALYVEALTLVQAGAVRREEGRVTIDPELAARAHTLPTGRRS